MNWIACSESIFYKKKIPKIEAFIHFLLYQYCINLYMDIKNKLYVVVNWPRKLHHGWTKNYCIHQMPYQKNNQTKKPNWTFSTFDQFKSYCEVKCMHIVILNINRIRLFNRGIHFCGCTRRQNVECGDEWSATL